MTELTFLKVLMLIRELNQRNMLFVTIGIFEIQGFRFNWMSAMDVIMY